MNYSVFYYIPKNYYRKISTSDFRQRPVYSSSEIRKLLLSKEPVYVTHALFKNEHEIFPTSFFYDFDCDKESAKKEIKKLETFCKRYKFAFSITEPKRGFHFYIHILPVRMNARAYSILSDHITSEMSIENYDDHVDGVIVGLSRLPGSYYPEINRRVRLITQKLYTPKNPFELLNEEEFMQIKEKQEIHYDSLLYRPCIDYYIREKHPSQLLRFAWCALRISQGKTDKEILTEAQSYNWEDFDTEYTFYQIQQIRRKKYIVPSCNTLRRAGYCNPTICEWRRHKKDLYKK